MDANEFFALAARDPQGAADHLDQASTQLKQIANELRAYAPPSEGGVSRSGMTDRVRMRVIGSAGQLKQSIDTQEQS